MDIHIKIIETMINQTEVANNKVSFDSRHSDFVPSPDSFGIEQTANQPDVPSAK